jgi:3',5'-nucleoside bisphosphate phosphatase
MTFRADLHTHTNFSDGSLSPSELLHAAKAAGLQGVSITDHDTVDAYSDELFKEAQNIGIELLQGVEISTRHKEHDIHVLGYGIDLQSAAFRGFLKKIQERREERNRIILQKLAKKKMPISEEEFIASYRAKLGNRKVLGRAHIAHMMVQKGYVSSMQEAFQHYLKDSGCCYEPGVKFTPLEAIHEIHQAKGKAVIAHPHFIHSRRTVKELMQMPFDGIECYYAKLNADQERRWLDLAKEKGLIATGGSDFHGEMKSFIPIGCSWVAEEVFLQLKGGENV